LSQPLSQPPLFVENKRSRDHCQDIDGFVRLRDIIFAAHPSVAELLHPGQKISLLIAFEDSDLKDGGAIKVAAKVRRKVERYLCHLLSGVGSSRLPADLRIYRPFYPFKG